MAPHLSNNLVKAFAKQMIFYNIYQVRVGSGMHNRKPNLQRLNQMGELIFLCKRSLEMENSEVDGASKVWSEAQATSFFF